MTQRAPAYSPEEFSRRSTEIYDRDIRPELRPDDDGKFVAIDVDSGEFEIDANDFEATERLLSRRPKAQMWLTRAGRPAAYRIGYHSRGAK
jgi:hypothetical protein